MKICVYSIYTANYNWGFNVLPSILVERMDDLNYKQNFISISWLFWTVLFCWGHPL